MTHGFDRNGWPKQPKRPFRLTDFIFDCVPYFIALVAIFVVASLGYMAWFHITHKCVKGGLIHQPASCTDYGNGTLVCLPDRYEQGCVQYERR